MKYLFLFLPLFAAALHAEPVQIPQGIDHQPFDRLLTKYVDDQGLVDYKSWKENAEDMQSFSGYLTQFASDENPAEGNEQIAGLLNAYNAFTIKLILDNYPTESIRLLDDPFKGKHHLIGGRRVSSDEIEHDTLRPLIGWKVHALVVCAARSCPPLPRNVFRADTWESQMKTRYEVWLAREDLNEFYPKKNRAEISKIFDWYKEDFTGDHSVDRVLRLYGPEKVSSLITVKKMKIDYKDYHWGLNDQSDLGKEYSHSFFKSLF